MKMCYLVGEKSWQVLTAKDFNKSGSASREHNVLLNRPPLILLLLIDKKIRWTRPLRVKDWLKRLFLHMESDLTLTV